MPATSFPEYAQSIHRIIDEVVAAGEVALVRLEIDARSSLRGLLSGVLRLADGSELHFREFVDVSLPQSRLMYAYHYQHSAQALVFRYDNAAHRPSLPAAEHKHTARGVTPSRAPTLGEVLDEALMALAP